MKPNPIPAGSQKNQQNRLQIQKTVDNSGFLNYTPEADASQNRHQLDSEASPSKNLNENHSPMNRCSFIVVPGKVLRGGQIITIRLRARINGQKTELDIERVPVNFFDKETNSILKGPFYDKNLVLKNAISKAISIEVKYKLSEMVLTVDKFKKEFYGNSVRGDLITYMENDITQRLNTNEIAYSTYRQHMVVANKLREFASYLPIGDISKELFQRFDIWNYNRILKSNKEEGRKVVKDAMNTRGANLKIIKTYVTRILEDLSLGIPNPFHGKRKLKVFREDADKCFLEKEELEKLYILYTKSELRPKTKEDLRSFLFACFCGGFRHTDRHLIRYEDVVCEGNTWILKFVPFKTQRNKQSYVSVPLNKTALELLGRGNIGPIFGNSSSSDLNKNLKLCAALCGITKNINFKVARETFAVQFLENGGNVEVLQKLLGHSDIRSTMVYVKITDRRRNREILGLDNILGIN